MISNSYSWGNVSLTDSTGATRKPILQDFRDDTLAGTITNSYSLGSVTVAGTNPGPVYGFAGTDGTLIKNFRTVKHQVYQLVAQLI